MGVRIMDNRTMITKMISETSSTWGRYEALVDILGHEKVADALARWMDSSYLKEALDDLMDDYGVYDDETGEF